MQNLNQKRIEPCAQPPKQVEPALVLLRVTMRKCRAKPRVEVFETCALLLHGPDQGAQAYADALLRVLSGALPVGPVIHDVSAAERSFDESWLVALFDAMRREDTASATFLLRSRLPLHLRRPIGWLAAELMRRMAGISIETSNRRNLIYRPAPSQQTDGKALPMT